MTDFTGGRAPRAAPAMRRPSNDDETCLCAALKMPDGYIVRGHRHDDCIITAAYMPRYDKAMVRQGIQGFLTTRGRFVDRTEALALQKAAGHDLPGALLFSEDLY